MRRILKVDLPDCANKMNGTRQINVLCCYNLWVLAESRSGVANGWWQALWFVSCLILSSRMFVIVNPAAPRQGRAVQCSTFLNNNQIQNGQVKPKSNCPG
jgi:hypothetical protein